MSTRIPLLTKMCATCPFRPGSKYASLKDDLTESALTEGSRICHSTGANNGINKRTGKPSMLCRGARDAQLYFFHSIGFIDAATDAAWEKKQREMKLPTNRMVETYDPRH